MNKKWIGWTVAVAAVAAGAYYFIRKPAGQPISYREETVARGDLLVKILSTGSVQPENRLEIKPPISGRVESILVDEGASVKKGQILAMMSSTERAALLDAARAKGPGEVKRWEQFYQATPILAPIAGEIILRNVEPGQTVTSQDALYAMSDRLTVKAQVDETDLAQIKLKQRASIALDAYPDSTIQAHVDQIAFEAKTVNSVTIYIVDVLPDHPSPLMRSGMTANVSFVTADKKGILLVPANAIVSKAGRTFVLMPPLKPRGDPAEMEVRLGLSDGKKSEIVAGLAEGDKIWIAGTGADSGKEKGGTNPFSPFSNRRR